MLKVKFKYWSGVDRAYRTKTLPIKSPEDAQKVIWEYIAKMHFIGNCHLVHYEVKD